MTRKRLQQKNDEEQPTCSKNLDGQGTSAKSEESPPKDGKVATDDDGPIEFTVPISIVHEKQTKSNLKQEKSGGQSSDEGEWTLVKDETSNDGSSAGPKRLEKETPTGKSDTSDNSKKSSSSETGSRQPGPLDLLLAMGFRDENGSLARLLQASQNDIGKVLENMEKWNMKG